MKLIKVSDETHRLLKIAAAYEQRSITAIADVAVMEYINRVKKEAGARSAPGAIKPAAQAVTKAT
jgi:predicted transcriptional regulator